MLFIVSELVQLKYAISKKQNYIFGFFCMMILGLFAAITSPTHNADYTAYMNDYNISPHVSSSSFHFEKGYTYFARFFYHVGFTYQQFRFIFALLCVVIMYFGVKRFTNNVTLFSFIYGVTLFVIDSVQIRNFMMVSLVVFGSSMLIDNSKRNIVIATIVILISGQFHSLGYLFLFVVLLRMFSFKFLLKNMYVFMGLSVFIMISINIIGIPTITKAVAFVISMLSNRSNIVSKIASQYNYGTVPIRYVAVAASALFGFATFGLIVKVLELNNDKLLTNKLHVLYSGALISIIMLPTLSLANDYSRIPRASFIFIIIAIAIYYEMSDDLKINKMRSLITFFIIIICFMTGFSHFFTWGTAYRSNFLYLIGLLH